MLCLTRRTGERLHIGEATVEFRIQGRNQVFLAIDAPPSVHIRRAEIPPAPFPPAEAACDVDGEENIPLPDPQTVEASLRAIDEGKTKPLSEVSLSSKDQGERLFAAVHLHRVFRALDIVREWDGRNPVHLINALIRTFNQPALSLLPFTSRKQALLDAVLDWDGESAPTFLEPYVGRVREMPSSFDGKRA